MPPPRARRGDDVPTAPSGQGYEKVFGRHLALADAWAWVATAALAGSGCSLIIDADRSQCRVDADCTSRGPSFVGTVCDSRMSICAPEPAWACLDAPPSPRTEPGPFHVELPLADLVTLKPLIGVSAQLCAKVDVNCIIPLTPVMYTDSQGVLAFDLSPGFDGYVQLRGASINPTLYFFNPPVDHAFRAPPSLFPNAQLISALAVQINAPLLPDRGMVVLMAMNCMTEAAAGISYSTPGADEKVVPFYVAGGLPVSTVQTTDVSGLGGLANVLAGASTFTGSLKARNREVSSISLLVRPGNVSYSRIIPRSATGNDRAARVFRGSPCRRVFDPARAQSRGYPCQTHSSVSASVRSCTAPWQ